MKKIVAFVTAVSEDATATPASEDCETDRSDGNGLDTAASRDTHSMKVEVIVSDSQAKRILADLVECGSETLEEPDLDVFVQRQIDLAGSDVPDLCERILIDVERRVIAHVYEDCNRIKTKTAARLGIDRNTLHKKLRQYNLIPDGEDVA